MKTATAQKRNLQGVQSQMRQPLWQRIILLIVLGYEAAGCLLGGALLVAAPDGRYMDMPVPLLPGQSFSCLVY